MVVNDTTKLINNINDQIEIYKKILDKYNVFYMDVVFITLFGLDYE